MVLSVLSWAASVALWTLPLAAHRVFNSRPRSLYKWASASDLHSLSSTEAFAPISTTFEAPHLVS